MLCYRCGVEDSKPSPPRPHFPMVRRVVWPPPTTSSQPALRNAYLDPRSLPMGNPNMGSKMQLYCKTGFFLAVYPNGQVRGSREEDDEFSENLSHVK